MQIKHRISILLSLALLVSMFLGCLPAVAADDVHAPQYNYYLRCTKKWDETDKTVELELYVRPSSTQVVLDGGCFGLRFPKHMGDVTFKANVDHVTISPIVPKERVVVLPGDVLKKDNYLAFGWLRSTRQEFWDVGEVDPGIYLPGIRDHLFIGTFTFTNLAAQPFKTDLGLMNFLNTAEAIPTELPEDQQGDPAKDAYNVTVWDAANSNYMGYFLGNTGTIERTAVGLEWTPPGAWKNAFTILSYDPKKPMTVELCDEAGALIANAIKAPKWEADSATLYAATEANKGKGTGAYFAAVDFADFKENGNSITAVKDTEYILRIKKACHLTVELKLTATSTNFAECTGFPGDNAPVYLPCGDINPVAYVAKAGKYIFGNGAITLDDRSLLTAFLDMKIELKSPNSEEVDGENPAYFADLDGDGAVTLVDLSILTAQLNFAKRSQ